MQSDSVVLEKVYYTDSIYLCQYPASISEIVKVPAGTKIPPMGITGSTFDICKEQVRIVAEARVKRLEQELIAAQKHLIQVLSLKESDVK